MLICHQRNVQERKTSLAKHKCKQCEEQEEGLPLWMATFADMMTLLFAFLYYCIQCLRLTRSNMQHLLIQWQKKQVAQQIKKWN